ncbi:MAG: hypothetical protein ACLPJH_01780 [Myxococcaceae bacterium]
MSGDLEGARRLFEQALRLDPECERARELLGTKPAVEALPEELQSVPSSTTNLFAVPLPRLFSEPVVEQPEAPTDPFIPVSLAAPLPPPAVSPPAAPLPSVTVATPAKGTPLPPPAGTPRPGPQPARGTPVPAAASMAVPPRTPLPAAPPKATPPPRASLGRTPVPSEARAAVAPPVPLPEPSPRPAAAAVSPPPATVGSDDWWTDGVSTPAPPPKDAWEVGRSRPTTLPPSEAAEGDALNLVAPLPASAGGTPLPAKMPKDPRHEARMLLQRARELQELDDHSGARELLLQAQALDPEAPEVARALAESEQTLQALYESKLGKLAIIPRVRLREDEVIWLNLDHRAGFILAQIDGTMTFDDLFSVSGMSRLDTARILVQLLEQRVIIR